MSTQLSLKDTLAEAKREYHALMTGLKPKVIVDSNGERVEFTSANRDELKKYISNLESQVGGSSSVRRPATLVF